MPMSRAVSSEPMPPKMAPSQQITIRVPAASVEEADALAEALSRPDIPILRADVLRAAIARGLVALREETATKPTKARARKTGLPFLPHPKRRKPRC